MENRWAEFGRLLKAARQLAGWNTTKLITELRQKQWLTVSAPQLSQWESGLYHPHNRGIVVSIITVLNDKIDEVQANQLLDLCEYDELIPAESEKIFNYSNIHIGFLRPNPQTERFLKPPHDNAIVIDGSIAPRGSIHPNLSEGWRRPDGLVIVPWQHGDAAMTFPLLAKFETEWIEEDPPTLRPEERNIETAPIKSRHVVSSYFPIRDRLAKPTLVVAPMRFTTWASVCAGPWRNMTSHPLDGLPKNRGKRSKSLRQQYGDSVLHPENTRLPSVLFVAMLVIGPRHEGKYAIIGHNTPAYHQELSSTWSASYEGHCSTEDITPFHTASREIKEEFGVSDDDIIDIKFLCLAIEYPSLATGLIGVVEIKNEFDEVHRIWKERILSKDPERRIDPEHDYLVPIDFSKESVLKYIKRPRFSYIQGDTRVSGEWHPSSRMRLALGIASYDGDVDIMEWCQKKSSTNP